jgi:UDPglucose--hexose-1-phosphate uridylyltransferase
MNPETTGSLKFRIEDLVSKIIEPGGVAVEKPVQVRTDPVTGRTCRITFARSKEKETGTSALPEPPPAAKDTRTCPFCIPQLAEQTPMLAGDLSNSERLEKGKSALFPNLFPYGRYSAVSLFDNRHFVEIGKASLSSYTDSFINCRRYLQKVLTSDPAAVYMAITQNHLPSAGGSLVHPHLQVHADRLPPNNLRFLEQRSANYHKQVGNDLFSDYLAHELADKTRLIGRTGSWHWMAAFAPEGFFEVWGILPGACSILDLNTKQWASLSEGVLNTQKFYRSLNRNGYNLGLLAVETGPSRLEMRVRILARSNYAPWVRNDHTGYEVMLGDMATFNAPEETAAMARPFF